MFLTTRGLVLREVRYKEADKILTVLTQHEGKVTVRARGALRKGSRITAATQLLTYSDMTIFENRGRRTLNEASTVEEFLGLRADLGAFALGSYFAELLETVSAEEYPDPPVLQLGLNSLYALSRALCPPEQIKAVFELRLMCLAGYEPDNYENLDRHADAHVIVNTTPVGMYPNTGRAAVDLRQFPQCAGVLDIVYNPARTALLLQAESLGIPCAGGLYMLVAQAKRSCEVFTDTVIDDAEILRIHRLLRQEMENIVLIGMPGSGKSTIAALLAERLHRPVLDSDAQVVETAGMSIPDIFAAGGEDAFRARETAALAELGKRSGTVLATGGGCVCRAENYPLLHQNGTIFWLQRDLALLPKDGRPISQRSDLAALYAQRAPLYARFADAVIDNNGTPEETVRKILEVLA